MVKTYTFNTVDSTNVLAKQLAEEGAAHGTGVIARNQTAGRGRLGKNWHSVEGKGLYCSVIVRPQLSIQEYPKLTLVAGVAVAQVLEALVPQKVQLKWPNDLFFGGKKCGGILAESSSLVEANTKRYAVIGIGININHTLDMFPLELQDQVTSLFIESKAELSIEEVYEKLRIELLAQVKRFEDDGFNAILEEWRQRDYLLGRQMECVNTSGVVVSGVALGPDDGGELHVRDENGQVHKVLSGDVQLARKRV